MDIITKIFNKTKIKEGPEIILNFLKIVAQKQPIPLAELAKELALPIPVTSAIRRELEKEKLLIRKGGVYLSDEGKEFVEKKLGVIVKKAKVVTPEIIKKLENQIGNYINNSPRFDPSLDQTSARPETIVKRAVYMDKNYALLGKKILILGDDDIISVVIKIFEKEIWGTDKIDVTVLEIDKRWCNYIEQIAKENNFTVKVTNHDLRNSIPHNLENQFDVIETDTPYTIEGFKLFLRRGIAAIKKEQGKDMFISFGSKTPNIQRKIQNHAINTGLFFKEIIPNFNHYMGAMVIGSLSNMYHLQTTESVSEESWLIDENRIYTSQEKE